MTWFQLWKRIGKQPLRLTKYKDVTLKLQDEEHKCKIVYTDNGNDWYLEIDGRTTNVGEVVHGQWRLETDKEEPNPMFKLVVCMVCSETANGTYNYCPNCGARMDGGLIY